MKYLYQLTYCFLILLFSTQSLDAAHIIGGDMTYVCEGPDPAQPGNMLYTITMKVYRDCDGSGASFDSAPNGSVTGTVSVFEGTNTNQFIPNIQLSAPVISQVDPSASNPCLIVPPNVCVEQGVYVFELSLPVSTEVYHIVYQRCCRNNSIFNIVDPGESGATYTVSIAPLAQQECNSSPVYNDFPPAVICVNEPLSFDHSATDAEGDQLIYSLCSPLLGGSTNNVAPNPDDYPALFQEVQFVLPNYSAQNPIGGNPVVSIDPMTGLITGVPNVQGQFVVGICVQEFRNGVLLSTVQRDFQFNVTVCEPTVEVDLGNSLQTGNNFIFQSCSDSTFTFINQSVDEMFIQEYYWEFDMNTNSPLTLSDRDVTVTFPGPGQYTGVMILNPGTDCTDTAYVDVFIAAPVEPAFSFDYDTCVAGPVTFTDLSVPNGALGFRDWEWDFGDGDTSHAANPIHEYDVPGVKTVTLKITDEIGCIGTQQEEVTWFPVPPVIIIEPSTFVGCPPAEVTFTNLSTPIDSTYEIVWDFGDGTSANAISPVHVYEQPAVYDVGVEITSPIGCFTRDSFPRLIDIDSLPVADFTFSPDRSSNFDPTVTFTDQSRRATYWNWTFGDFSSTIGPNPTYTFPDTGIAEVKLLVTHFYGCLDSIVKIVDIEPQINYFLPNAFTPNDDAKNELFQAAGFFRGIRDFDMKILNRYGEVVFTSRDPAEGWNGRKNNTGKRAPAGVYVYIINFTGPRGQPTQYTGYATIIR